MKMNLHPTTIRGAAALAACLVSSGAAATAAGAATFCVGGPSACPPGSAQLAGLQAALDAAEQAAGHDVVLLGAGAHETSKGFTYDDNDVLGNTVEIVGEGDSTVLQASTPAKGNGFHVLFVAAGEESRIARLRVIVPDGATDADQTTGLRTDGEVAVEEIRVQDAGTTGAKAAGTGVTLAGGGTLSRSVVHMSGDTEAVKAGGSSTATVADVDLHGRYGVRRGSGGTTIVRRAVIRSPWRGATATGGTLVVESTLVEITGAAGNALAASNHQTQPGKIKASHVTLIGGSNDNTKALSGESEADADTTIDVDNSILRGFERGVSRRATVPQGSVVVKLASVDYNPANDYSEGDGEIQLTDNGFNKVGFVDPDTGDYRLHPASALIDAGRATSFVTLSGKDLAGNPRTVGDARDLGAYEYQALAPTAVISGALQALQGAPLAFSGAGSHDPDAGDAIAGWSWTFGDGTQAVGRDVEHVWSAPGTYEVVLTVTDTNGKSGTTSALVTVAPAPSGGPGTKEPGTQNPIVDPAVDRTAPVLGGLRRRGRTVTLTLSETARLAVRLERRLGRRYRAVGGTRRFAGATGRNTLRNAVRKVGRGRYRLTVTATDALGNRSVKRLSFRAPRLTFARPRRPRACPAAEGRPRSPPR